MEITAKARFDQMHRDRSGVIQRARSAAKLTLPFLFPEEGHSADTDLPQPNQSIGARGVNHLAAKLTLTLFPPSASFFRILLTEPVEDNSGVQKGLAAAERTTVQNMEAMSLRPKLSEGLKHLLVTGNTLLYLPDDGYARLYPLTHYVVERAGSGQATEIITLDEVSPSMLEESERRLADIDEDATEPVNVYTHLKLVDDTWEAYQEINDQPVPGTETTYPKESPAYIPLTWNRVNNEDYGRGLIEENYGDLWTLEKLTTAMTKGAAAAAKILYLIESGSEIEEEDISDSESGDVLRGRASDVTTLQLDKYADFRWVHQYMESIEQRLAQSFLLHSSIQRNAERVTAEEIRYLAQELEDALGGNYATLSAELQRPLVSRVMSRLMREGVIPELDSSITELQITTGVEALGRSHEVHRLMQFFELTVALLGEEETRKRISPEDLIDRLAANTGVDVEDLFRSSQEVEQEMMKQQAQQIAGTAGEAAAMQAVQPQET